MPDVTRLLTADGDDFVTRSLPVLPPDPRRDRRRSSCRRRSAVPTRGHLGIQRGTPIANTRQLSIVSLEDCAEIALLLEIDEVDPALLGANVVIGGFPQLSLLAPASRLQFPSGATIFITEQNAPCRHPAEKARRSA